MHPRIRGTVLLSILTLSASVSASEPIIDPTFTPTQQRVLKTAGKAPDLQGRVASFFGITEARLVGMEVGRVSILLAQYLVFKELEADNFSEEQKSWSKQLLRDQDWGMKVFWPFEAEAKEQKKSVCPQETGVVPCYYFVLAKDMRVRLQAKAPLP